MPYYVEIEDGKIVAKLEEGKPLSEIPENFREISPELYQSIGIMPCSFDEVDGEIVNVEHIPLPPSPPPEPTEIEVLTDYIVDVDFRLSMVELGLF